MSGGVYCDGGKGEIRKFLGGKKEERARERREKGEKGTAKGEG